MSDMTLLRIGIAVAVSLLLGAIIFFGRGRKDRQGRRVTRGESGDDGGRQEPTLGEQLAGSWGQGATVEQEELQLQDTGPIPSELGKRPLEHFDRIVSLYVAAKAGARLHGQDIVVAAEKAGLDRTALERDYPRTGEVPFSSETKRMAAVHGTPEGRSVAYVKGSPRRTSSRRVRSALERRAW